jgi:hypothetical protein
MLREYIQASSHATADFEQISTYQLCRFMISKK